MRCISIERDFRDDWISRSAGERLRNRILSITAGESAVEVDFRGVTIGSTSFLDEGLAKLAHDGWDMARFQRSVIIVGMNRFDRSVLDRLLAERFC